LIPPAVIPPSKPARIPESATVMPPSELLRAIAADLPIRCNGTHGEVWHSGILFQA